MITIQVDESTNLPAGDFPALERLLTQAALQTILAVGADENAEVTVLLSDDVRLHGLNRQFLGVDAPTDILSFPDGDTDPETGLVYLGDMVISMERASAQAAAGKHAVGDELQLLVVHGMLHLLGHDHAEEEEKAAMWEIQQRVLAKLGVALNP